MNYNDPVSKEIKTRYSILLPQFLILVVFTNILGNVIVPAESKTTTEVSPPENSGESLSNQQKFTECTKIKSIEDCLPVLYSTAILAVVTTFLLTFCGVFICCMVFCTARWRSRERQQRLQLEYALVGTRTSDLPSPTDSVHFCPMRHDPDPPPNYPGLKSSSLIVVEDEPPPPPYTPSFRPTSGSETRFGNS